jgi:hypothetical protein
MWSQDNNIEDQKVDEKINWFSAIEVELQKREKNK